MSRTRAFLILLLLFTVCVTVATCLQPAATAWNPQGQSGDVMTSILGGARRMFANHFFVKADIYFHRGYYPSIFDQGRPHKSDAKNMMAELDEKDEHEHEQAMEFLGQPRDWMDRFGRNFFPSTHSHLDGPGEAREILPWLRISADLDPHNVDTYVVASYWLRNNLGRPDEAKQFLREGFRANPDSYEILFELGKLFYVNLHDPVRARNVWEAALQRWHDQEKAGKKPDELTCDGILINLSHLEEQQGNLPQALQYLQQEEKVSPQPDVIKKREEELKQKMEK